MTSIPRLLPLFLAAIPTAALAESPAGDAIPVVAVPALTVASGVAGPGATPPGLAPAYYYAPPAPTDAAPEPIGIDRRVREDRAAERSYLAPTALIAPRGTTTFTVLAPLAPGASFRLDRSFSDRLSLGVGVVGAFGNGDLVGVGSLHGKYQLWRSPRAALALTASIYNFPGESDPANGKDLNVFIPGLAASMCTDDACRTLLSVDVEALAGVDDQVLPIVGGVSIATGIKRQLIAEIHTTTDNEDRLWFGFVGGRFLGAQFAFDVGLGFAAVTDHPAGSDCSSDPVEPCVVVSPGGATNGAYPFVALSTRL